MNKFIIIILATIFLSISINANEKYLDGREAHLLIQKGNSILCIDKETKKKYLLKSNQYVFSAGGLYFYNVNKEPIMTTMCIVNKI